MTEINNNIPKFNIEGCEKIDKKYLKTDKEPKVEGEKIEPQYVQDTGVLGRSQVRTKKGADITKSVDEAVRLAVGNPVLLDSSNLIFDKSYDNFLAQGYTPTEAYTKALLAEEEFLSIADRQSK